MIYAHVIDGIVVAYPYTKWHLQHDNPHTTFPSAPTDAQLAEFNVFRVKRTPKPELDETYECVETVPIQIDGEWVQQWAYDKWPDVQS